MGAQHTGARVWSQAVSSFVDVCRGRSDIALPRRFSKFCHRIVAFWSRPNFAIFYSQLRGPTFDIEQLNTEVRG